MLFILELLNKTFTENEIAIILTDTLKGLEYLHLKKKTIDKILGMRGRSVVLKNGSPMTVVGTREIFVLAQKKKS